jgi:hypothetical protein
MPQRHKVDQRRFSPPEIRHRLDRSVREQLHSSRSCRSHTHNYGDSSFSFMPSCVLLLVCVQEHGVYFYPFAHKSTVCTFAHVRTRASCVLLPVCEQEHGVYFCPCANKSTVCTFARVLTRAKRDGRHSAARSSRRECLLLSIGRNRYGLGRSWIDLLRLGEDQVDLRAGGNANHNVLRRH